MQTIAVAVGSTRPLKLRAVSDALESLGSWLEVGTRFDVVGVAAPSGVSHTPLSRAELMAGARSRAGAAAAVAKERGEPWKYFVGLEGGLDVVYDKGRRLAFLESWALAADVAGRESWGHAGGIVLPESLAAEVIDGDTELSEAVDALAGEKGIRDAQGAWGVLTRNLITRHDVLRIATINAFAPFFNATLYPRSG